MTVNVSANAGVSTTVQKRGSYYHICIKYKDAFGKWKCTTESTGLKADIKNKRKAEKICNEVLQKWQDRTARGSDILLADLFVQWLDEVKPLKQPTTYRGYESNMRNHIIPYFLDKRLKLCDLKPKHLNEYYSVKLGEGLNAQTVRHHAENISAAIRMAQENELIRDNPVSLSRKPKVEGHKGKFLNPEQVTALIKSLDGSVVRIPVIIGAFYGLRRAEILGLKWEDVDFVNGVIHIQHSYLQNTGGDYERDGLKNSSSFRTLPMTEYITELLKAQKEHQQLHRERLGEAYKESDNVCTWDDGKIISPNYLTVAFKKILVENNLPVIRLHDLRHSVASNFLNNGFTIVEVQHWLGHSSPSTTLNFYSHISSDQAKKNMGNSMENMILKG